MTTIKIGISDLVRNPKQLQGYDFVEIEDKKTHRIRGVYLSEAMAKEFRRYLEEKRQEKIDKKLEAFESVVAQARESDNDFSKEDPKVLQKIKGMAK